MLGNRATQFLAMAVRGRAALEGLNVRVYDADYSQIDAQLLDRGSEVYAFQTDRRPTVPEIRREGKKA